MRGLVETLRALLARWEGSAIPGPGDVRGWPFLDERELRACDRLLRRTLPAGVGHALLTGSGAATTYISSGERAGMTELFRDFIDFAKGNENESS